MTPKQRTELERVARKAVLHLNEITPDQWDTCDQRDCEYLIAILAARDAAVLEEAAVYLEKVATLYGNDGYRERRALDECAETLRQLAQERRA